MIARAIAARLLQAVPVFLVISVLVFFISHLGGDDPITNALAGILPQDAIDTIRREYGLDRPVWVQYGLWLQHLLAGDWGLSLTLRVPVFWSGLVLIWVFAVQLDWLPASGMYDLRGEQDLADLLRHLVLPAFSAAIVSMLILAQLVRASVIEIAGSDYVRTYRAQGFARTAIWRRHLARNLLPPVVNITGLQIGYLLSGVIFVENVFAWPGIGTHLYNAAAGKDYPMTQAGVMLITGCYLAVNLATDVLLDLLNPRLRA